MIRRVGILLACALLSATTGWAQVQQPSTGGGGGAGASGVVDQGNAGVQAWSIKVNQTGSNNAVDVVDRVARILGKITFDGAQAVTQSGAWAISFTAPQHIICDSGCAAGSPGQQTMANSSPVVIASNQSAVPVSGTFWQATQPVSGTFWQVTQPVSGTFFQATQPISGTVTANAGTGTLAVSNAGTFAVQSAATQSGTWTVQPGNTANTTAWKVDGSAVTQPVSGTVTANAGTGTFAVSGTVTANAGTNLNTSALALSATQTNRSQKSQLTDGTNDGTIKAASTAALAIDTSYVTALSPNSPLPAGSNVIGHVIVDSSGVLHVIIDSSAVLAVTGPLTDTQLRASAVPVSGTFWQATQPVSGTVTANQGGTWTVQPGNTANTTAWKVDGSAVTQPVSGTFWQGTQPVSGTFWQVTQPVSIASMPSTPVTGTFWQATQPVSGTVTTNAGTNLNTSALSLETTQQLQATVAAQTTGNASLTTIASAVRNENTVAADLDPSTPIVGVRTDLPGTRVSANLAYETLQLVQGWLRSTLGGRTDGGPIVPLNVNTTGALQTFSQRGLPLQPCNPVRQTNCSPKGF